jgi:tetratricopeptide (TPR) repeat protein
MATSDGIHQIQDQAQSERRLGLLILENKDGAALAAGIPHFAAAMEAWRQLGWPSRVAEVQLDLARLHAKAHHHAACATVATEAMHTFAGEGDERAIDAAVLAASALLVVGRPSEALAALRRGAEIADQRNDHLRLAVVKLELARAYLAAGDAALALTEVTAAHATFLAFRRQIEVARCAEVAADAHTVAGDPAAAAAAYERAIGIHQELGRPVEASEVLGRFADWHRDHGDLAQAEAVLERALTLQGQTGKSLLVAHTLCRLGSIHAKRGDAVRAVDRYQRSLELCRSLGDQDGTSRALYLLGATDIRAGQVDQGLARLQESLAVAEAANLPALREPVLAAIARVYRSRGEHDAALAVMQRWVAVLKSQGDRADALQVLGQIAEIYQDKGAWSEAEAHLQRLVAVTGGPADRDLHARCLRQLAVAEARRGAYSDARAHITEALAALVDAAPETRAALLAQVGHIALQQVAAGSGDQTATTIAAEEHLRQAEAIWRTQGDESALARVLVDLGNARHLLGQDAAAEAAFAEAAALCEKRGDVRATQRIRRRA